MITWLQDWGWEAVRRERGTSSCRRYGTHSAASAWRAGTVVYSFLYTLPNPGTIPGKQQALNKSLLGEWMNFTGLGNPSVPKAVVGTMLSVLSERETSADFPGRPIYQLFTAAMWVSTTLFIPIEKEWNAGTVETSPNKCWDHPASLYPSSPVMRKWDCDCRNKLVLFYMCENKLSRMCFFMHRNRTIVPQFCHIR